MMDYRGGYTSPCVDERSRQIKTLRIFNENVSELSANLQYRVDFSGEEGRPLSLFLTLGPYFPSEPPEIYLSPPPSHHPWTNPSGRVVAAPGLLAYNALHTDLGRLVQAIKRQFQLTPLSVAPSSNGVGPHPPSFAASSTPSLTTTSPHLPPKNNNSFYPQRPEEHSPNLFFPELSSLSSEKLRELNSDPTSLQLFYKTECTSTRKRVLSRLVEENTSLKTEIESLSANILPDLSARFSEGDSGLKDRVKEAESLKSELISATEAYVGLKKEGGNGCLSTACDNFRAVIAQTEDESDRIAEGFLDGEFSSPEEFLKKYFNLRNEYHLRKSQSEKMAEKMAKPPKRFQF